MAGSLGGNISQAIRGRKMKKEISVPPSRCHTASPGFWKDGNKSDISIVSGMTLDLLIQQVNQAS